METTSSKATALPKVYVETSVLSRLTDYFMSGKQIDMNPADVAALDTISEDTSIELVTSAKTWDEVVKATVPDQRVVLKFLYRLMMKVPITTAVQPLPNIVTAAGGRSRLILGGNRIDVLLLELSNIFDSADAEHVYQAVKSDCQYFLTVDYKTILFRRDANKTKLAGLLPGLELVSPAELPSHIQ